MRSRGAIAIGVVLSTLWAARGFGQPFGRPVPTGIAATISNLSFPLATDGTGHWILPFRGSGTLGRSVDDGATWTAVDAGVSFVNGGLALAGLRAVPGTLHTSTASTGSPIRT